MLLILKTPLVTVPVLSITKVFILVIASKKEAPLNRLPSSEHLVVDSKSLESLQTLKNQNLVNIIFSHDTRIKDKDIDPLSKLDNLKYISFKKSLFRADEIKAFQINNPQIKVDVRK